LISLVIDTNALVSFVTDRDPAQQARVAAVIEMAARAQASLLCPQNVLTEFVYVLERVYGIESRRIARMIADFMDLPGVTVVDELDYSMLLALWPSPIPAYGDAVIAAVCLAHKGSAVATFDRKLRSRLRAARVPVHALA
jgi:predicted nucleic acid-binding protein